MPESNYVEFAPAWLQRNAGHPEIEETPCTGSQPEYAPRLPIRLFPSNISNSLSALTLSQTVACTQKILNYVSYEVVNGIQHYFSDLRSINEGVASLGKLSIDPFEEGSFVIPARLPAEPIEIQDLGEKKSILAIKCSIALLK
jgi:hypothetical protein